MRLALEDDGLATPVFDERTVGEFQLTGLGGCFEG
jgi:hypothetical protein